ncbi:MAG: FeS-binding protein, partial [Maribacter sp.]|nr:FeS-binding protein [Maribacter sp.]
MKAIKNSGLIIFILGLGIFTALIFIGKFEVNQETLDQIISEKGIKSEIFIEELQKNIVGIEFHGMLSLSPKITSALESSNQQHRSNKEYNKVIYTAPHDMAAYIGKKAGIGFIPNNKGIMWFLTFGLG